MKYDKYFKTINMKKATKKTAIQKEHINSIDYKISRAIRSKTTININNNITIMKQNRIKNNTILKLIKVILYVFNMFN